MSKMILSIRCFTASLFAVVALCSCFNENSVTFDTSKNTCRDDYKAVTIPAHLSKYALNLNNCGGIASIILPDTTAQIGKIDKVQIVGDRIYIMDEKRANSIFCFSLTGKLLWKYGKQGRGKGKFQRLGDMHVQNNKVYVFDNAGLKIILLDTLGLFIKEMKVPKIHGFYPDELFVDTNNNLVLYNFDMGDYETFPYEMTVMDPDCRKVLSYHLKKTHDPAIKRWNADISPLQYFSGNNGFYFTKALNDTIYSYANGTFARKYVVDFGKYKVPETVKAKKKYSIKDFYKSSYEGNIERVIENDSIICFIFGKGSRLGYSFIDKQSAATKSFGMATFNIDKYFQMLLPMATWQDKIIAVVSPMELIRYCDLYKKNNAGLTAQQLDDKLKREMPMIWSLRNQITLNSNPLLVFLNISRNKIFSNEKI